MSKKEEAQARVDELKGKIKELGHTIGEDGKGAIASDDLYNSTLEANGVTVAQAETLLRTTNEFVSAGHAVAGDIGIEFLSDKKNAEIPRVVIDIGLGVVGAQTSYINRVKENPNPKDPGGAKIITHGSNRAVVELKGTPGGATFKSAREAILAAGEAAFAEKK